MSKEKELEKSKIKKKHVKKASIDLNGEKPINGLLPGEEEEQII